MRVIDRLVLWVLVCFSVLHWSQALVRGQASAAGPSPAPAFEVASIKLHDPADPASGNFFEGRDRWVARNYTLRQLVRTAYQVQDYRVIPGPPWTDGERYDIDAKASAADVELRASRLEMVRTLLAQRFKLRLRQEQREMPVYVLTTARSDQRLGPALRRVEKRDCLANAPGGWCGIRGQGPGRVAGQQVTIDTIVLGLGGTVERVVLNRTGLSGVFDFNLEYTAAAAELAGTPSSGPSIFTALEEQLGLKLISDHAPVEVVVIESAERPTN